MLNQSCNKPPTRYTLNISCPFVDLYIPFDKHSLPYLTVQSTKWCSSAPEDIVIAPEDKEDIVNAPEDKVTNMS